jgi:hypothetical protein
MNSKQDLNGLSRSGSSSSMVQPFACISSYQASVRPTSVFAAPEVPTTPKKKRTIYGDRSLFQGIIVD